MKKVLVSLFIGCLMMIGLNGISQAESFAQIPNLKACYYYDFNSRLSCVGAESTLLKYKMLNLNVGYIDNDNLSNTVTTSLSVDLNKLGTVEYLWSKDFYSSIGVWAGYNFKESQCGYGVSIILIKIEFAK